MSLPVEAAPGDLAAYSDVADSTTIGFVPTNITWDTTIQQDGIFSLNAANGDVTVSESGHYLVLYNLPTRTTGGANRSEIQTNLVLNGTTDLRYGRSTGYIRRTQGDDEAYNAGGTILNLSASDAVRVNAQRGDSNASSTVGRRVGTSGFQLLRLVDSWDYLRTYFSADQAIGATTTFEDVVWDTDDEIDAGSFARSGADITLKTVGHYLVAFNLGNEAATIRTNDEARLTLDGAEIDGSRVNSYVRSADGNQRGQLVWIGLIETTTANQILNIEVRRESTLQDGSHVLESERSGLTIAKLPDTADYLRLLETTGLEDLSNTPTTLGWDTVLEQDTSSFDFNLASPTNVGFNLAGDYLFFQSTYGDKVSVSEDIRENFWAEWLLNATALGFGSAGSYVRGDNGGQDTRTLGASSGVLVTNLAMSDDIALRLTNEATNGSSTLTPIRRGMQAISLLTLFDVPVIAQLRHRWRDNTADLNTSGGFLAAENTPITIDRFDVKRLRLSVANILDDPDPLNREYQLQVSQKVGNSCNQGAIWEDVSTNTAFEMVDSIHINPDGVATSSSVLSNPEAYIYINGRGQDISSTTSTLSGLGVGDYTEFEFSLRATTEAVTGETYCFRLYDDLNNTELDSYAQYPELTLDSVAVTLPIGEYGQATLSGNAWQTVSLAGGYENLVVVASARYASDSTSERVPRIRNKTTNSFEIKVDTVNGNLTGINTPVDWMVMEAGTHELLLDDSSTVQVQAGTVNTSTVWANGTYGVGAGTLENFSPAFQTAPVVLHTISSDVDPTWAYSAINGGTTSAQATTTNLYVGLGRSFQTSVHGPEDVDYIAFEPFHGEHNGSEIEAQLSADNVACCSATGYSNNFDSAFVNTPQTLIVAMGGEDGGNGAWAHVHTGGMLSTTAYASSVDEDSPGSRAHTTENIYAVALSELSGTFIGTQNFDLTNYRWFENQDMLAPGVALANEREIYESLSNQSVVRLRWGLQTGGRALPAGKLDLKLQYGEGSTCEGIGTWLDVGGIGSGSVWRMFDNPSVTTPSVISSSLLDLNNNFVQNYTETNLSPNQQLIPVDETGEWEWVLQNNGASDGFYYCFRAVSDTNEIFHYSTYPKIKAGSPGQWWFEL